MAKFNAAKGTYEPKDFDLLPTDIYRMKVVKADIQQNTFGEQKEDGTYPEQLVLCWEVTQARKPTDEDPGQDEGVIGLSVWYRISPWYGTTKRGDSKFKQLVDSLIEQQLLGSDFDPENMDTDWFMGIEQRVDVELYKKTQGANKGQDGNKVVRVLPLTVQRKAPVKAAPVAVRPAVSTRPVARNVPVPVTEDESEEIPF